MHRGIECFSRKTAISIREFVGLQLHLDIELFRLRRLTLCLHRKVDLAFAKQRIGDRTCLLGNVDTVTALLQGTPGTVRTASEKCITDAANGGAYMLGSGCMVPRTVPINNVKAMVEVARSHENASWSDEA